MAGKKRALLMGINDYEHVSDLRGCVNDVHDYRELLVGLYGFKDSDVRVLTDAHVVKERVRKEWSWLTKDAGENDTLVVMFAGHGSYITDKNGDEQDGVDELLCLYDMDFEDPDTYLLDDEWEKMIRQAKGAHLTFIFDSCHSGTALRAAMARPGERAIVDPSKRPLIDPVLTLRRWEERHGNTRGLSAETDGATRALSGEDEEAVVRVRFIEPPAYVQRRLTRGVEEGGFRGVIERAAGKTGAVLLSGCRADQTSADATIDGKPRGAFSFHFCKTIRETGGSITYADALAKVRRGLAGKFSQIPQLEPEDLAEPVFGVSRTGTPPQPPTIVRPPNLPPVPPSSGNVPVLPPSTSGDGGRSAAAALADIIADLAKEKGADHSHVAKLVEVVKLLLSSSGETGRGGGGVRRLVYVHGICRHEAGYSDPWWDAMRPHLPHALQATLGGNRSEVLWSDLVDRAVVARSMSVLRDAPAPLMEALDARERALKEDIQASLEDRAQAIGHVGLPEQPADRAPRRSTGMERALFGIPGLDCVDDFVKYLTRNGVRREVQRRFLDVVVPRLDAGDHVDVISHSWGTVVAYEALRTLDARSGLAGRVGNLFTVGSALSIRPVVRMLETDGGSKPVCVDRWINLDAQGDIVGGSLAARGFAVDLEFLQLAAVGCEKNLFGAPNSACAHSSYFKAANDAVNRDLFARYLSGS